MAKSTTEEERQPRGFFSCIILLKEVLIYPSTLAAGDDQL